MKLGRSIISIWGEIATHMLVIAVINLVFPGAIGSYLALPFVSFALVSFAYVIASVTIARTAKFIYVKVSGK